MPALHRAVIGQIGNDYYLPIFTRFEAAGEATLSWNWSACLLNLNWMIFRGLWGVALVFAVVLVGMTLLLLSLHQLVFDWPTEVFYGLMAACLSLVFLVSGAWGNALFFNHNRKAMMAAIEANPTLALACAQLERQASSRRRFVTLLAVNGALLLALTGGAYVMLMGDDAAPQALLPVSPPAAAASAATSAAADASAAEPALASVSDPASAAWSVGSAPALVASAAEPAASAMSVALDVPAAPAQAVASIASASLMPAPLATAAPPISRIASASAAVIPAAGDTQPKTEASAAQPSLAKQPVTPVKTAASKPAAAPVPNPGFYVNAGLFANPDNASNTLAKLQAAGLPATSQVLATAQGSRTRVRAGPFAKRAQAEAAVKKIKSLKLDAALAKP